MNGISATTGKPLAGLEQITFEILHISKVAFWEKRRFSQNPAALRRAALCAALEHFKCKML